MVLGVWLLGSPGSAWAQASKAKWLTLQSSYSTYADLSASTATPTKQSNSIDVEVQFRIYHLMSLVLTAGRATDDQRQYAGFGLRFDLPGFFTIGATRRDAAMMSRQYPLNTYIFSHILSTSVKSTNDGTGSVQLAAPINAVATRHGLGVDLFLFQRVAYLTGAVSMYTIQGNSFIQTTMGIGTEF